MVSLAAEIELLLSLGRKHIGDFYLHDYQKGTSLLVGFGRQDKVRNLAPVRAT
jgi:hypothetical protein